jgi:hypothetical protein
MGMDWCGWILVVGDDLGYTCNYPTTTPGGAVARRGVSSGSELPLVLLRASSLETTATPWWGSSALSTAYRLAPLEVSSLLFS